MIKINNITKNLVLSGLFIAIGLLLPMIFHAFGLGTVFLPMHIPVLLCGFFLPFGYAAFVGAATPFLSSMLTGMPPLFPIMPYMVLELAIYGMLTSILYRYFRFNTYISLIISMIIGRIAAGIGVWILTSFFAAKMPSVLIFVSGAVVKGIPGIIIQLLFIPSIVILLDRHGFKKGENNA